MTSDELESVNFLAQGTFGNAQAAGVTLKWMTLSIPREGQKPLTVRCQQKYNRLMMYTELSK